MSKAATTPGNIRHFLQFNDFSREEILYVLDRARLIKEKFKNYQPHHSLHDRTLAMVFEKASTRTRVSFEAGMYQMGGSVIHLTTTDSQLGRSEPIEDTARVVSRMVDIVMIRTFEQTRIERFASHSRVPVINGLTNSIPCPTGYEEKEKWLKDMVAPLVDSIVPESSKEIAFINLAGNKERDIPLCEVKFKNRDIAIKIRREFAAQKKGGKDFGRLAVFNSVTLATRVRIEVLWALAKKRGNEKESATVQSYVSKPTLIIKDKEGKRKPLKLGFADAITRFGKTLREGDLASAYRKAGTSFQNVLQQNFVVLHDLNKSKAGPWGGKGGAADGFPQTGLKRVREPDVDKPKPSLSKPKTKRKLNKNTSKKN